MDLPFALGLASDAARIALGAFQRGEHRTELKPDRSLVTDTDRAVERALRETLLRERANDAVLGEELGRRGTHARTWILDPIDGTSEFAAGDPDWRVQIALEDSSGIALGVVVAPALGRCWWAERGGGAFEASWPDAVDVHRLAVSPTATAADAMIEAYPLDAARARLPGWNVHPLGTRERQQRVVPVQVARGMTDAFVFHGGEPWDHAPWIVLVEEAGGRFSDPHGERSAHRGGGVFSNAALHTELVRSLYG